MNTPDTGRPIPTAGQLAWQYAGMGMFLHFGINTFHGVEWSDGTLPPASFTPARLDADQWVELAAEIGAAHVVLTAKHHDGFCLWPTATTDYSVASSPWRDGRGDVVGEVERACRRHGVGLGLYVSPWDRHAACYDDPAAYDEFYLAQLTELCTQYGELAELWFDGAGSEGRRYDWTRIGAVIERTQPNAMVFNMGNPTIRWVGNEDGLADDPVHYVVDSTKLDNYTAATTALAEPRYLPPECDVSIRRGWFWQADDEPKSLEHLLGIHYRSIGMGAGLLLNLPPNRDGLIAEADLTRVREWRAELDRRFADPLDASLQVEGDTVRLDFGPGPDGGGVTIDHLELFEDLRAGQQVVRHEVRDEAGVVVADGGTVGVRRLHVCGAITARSLTVELRDDTGTPVPAALVAARGFATGHSTAPAIPHDYRAPTETPDDRA